MVQFNTLHPDGTLTNERTTRQASLAACPFMIFDPSHYRADESCKCNDPSEQAKMLAEWGYKPSDFRRAGIAIVAPKGSGRKVRQ